MTKRQTAQLMGYDIVGAMIGGKAQAAAHRGGSKNLFRTVDDSIEMAMEVVSEAVKEHVADRLSRRRADGDFQVPLQEEYVEGLALASLSKADDLVLRAHANAPGSKMTGAEIAEAGGYKSLSAATTMYNKLGKKLGDAMDVTAPTSPADPKKLAGMGILAWGTFDESDEASWVWEMRPELLEAMRQVGLARQAT